MGPESRPVPTQTPSLVYTADDSGPYSPSLKERNPDAAVGLGENFAGPEGPEAVLFGVQPQGLRPMGFEVGEQQQKDPRAGVNGLGSERSDWRTFESGLTPPSPAHARG